MQKFRISVCKATWDSVFYFLHTLKTAQYNAHLFLEFQIILIHVLFVKMKATKFYFK